MTQKVAIFELKLFLSADFGNALSVISYGLNQAVSVGMTGLNIVHELDSRPC